MRRGSVLGLAATLALLSSGCGKGEYHYADDVKVQFTEKEEVASIKAQLGCEGANPAKESDEEKTEREKRNPKTDLGKAWLKRACDIADAFDGAGPVTSWPEAKAVWAGDRICRTQISRVVGDKDTAADAVDDAAYGRLGRVEIVKGEGKKLWSTGPDIDRKDKLLGYSILFTDVTFKVTKDKLPAIEAFFKQVAEGASPDVETLRKDEAPGDRKTTDDAGAIVNRHNVPGYLVASEGTSTLAYPILGMKGEPSAIHYLRQKGDKLLIATPMIGASQPSACVAELTLQR